jgi:TRAP-type C4-dicarboxylate transport system substrate-binding protein
MRGRDSEQPSTTKDTSMSIKNTLGALAAGTALAATLAAPVASAQEMTFKVIGQPAATGLIQKELEKPFFENFAEVSGLPIKMDYKPLDQLGVKDTEQLRLMKAGLFDVVSLRVSQNSRDEPTLLGMDLVGLNPDFATGKATVKAFYDVVDQRLQEKFRVKLLGIWAFGPQMLFCKEPITQLADVKGLKVRVYDQNLAKFVESLGGIPVPLSFTEVHQSLSMGVVECAITGPSSANSSSWPEVTTHQLPLGFQLALNGYAITMKAWMALGPEKQVKMQAAFTKLTDDIWTRSEELWLDAVNCNVDQDPCTTGKRYKLTNVPVKPADIELVRGALAKISVPVWSELCDKSHPGCSEKWMNTVGPVVGLK